MPSFLIAAYAVKFRPECFLLDFQLVDDCIQHGGGLIYRLKFSIYDFTDTGSGMTDFFGKSSNGRKSLFQNDYFSFDYERVYC